MSLFNRLATTTLSLGLLLAAPAHAGKVAGVIGFDRETAPPLGDDASQADKLYHQAANKVVIWVRGPKDETPPKQPAQIVQGGSQFFPPLLVVPAGQTVNIINNDNVIHGAYSESKVATFDTGLYPKGETRSVTFDRPGLVRIGCPVHDDMRTSVVVVHNRFHAVVDPGKPFVISGLPEGEHTLYAWREGYRRLTVKVQVSEAAPVKLDLLLKAKADPTQVTTAK